MPKQISLTLEDEVNVRFDGLAVSEIKYLQTNTAQYVKGYFSTVRFKKRLWDGKESQLKSDGSTYVYMLDKLEGLLASLGYGLQQITLIDNRKCLLHPAYDSIDDTYLTSYGIDLRYYQVDAVNAVLLNQKGIIECGTSGGKSFMAAAIAKLYENSYESLVIVPNDNLGDAMETAFKSIGLNCKFITSDIKPKDREAHWKTTPHVISTYQSLKNSRKYVADRGVVIYDEVHIMGDMMYDMMATELAYAPIRVGLTGTVPPDKQKREKIFCRIGGNVIHQIDTATLSDEGYIAKAHVHMVQLHHEKSEITSWLKKKVLDELPWSWEIEERYLNTSKKRVEAIANLIATQTTNNTLILCEPEIGRRLAELTGFAYIDGDTPTDTRLELYKPFDSQKDYKLIATYGTVGTGISINDIYSAFLVDPGKDFTKILQGIGRTLRLDSAGVNRVDVYDVYSDLQYALRHKAKRIAIYQDKQFDFNPNFKTINIGL